MTTESVRQQYERFPYPPVPRLALPRKDQGRQLSYELGTEIAFGLPKHHAKTRILVAGCGTLEPVIVAQAHPLAEKVVALDLSEQSLSRLKARLAVARLTRPFSKWPRTELIRADLREWSGEQFDYIIASNVLHHVPHPEEVLKKLAGWLKPDGILRIVTYPKTSRIWMREASRWLRLHQSGEVKDYPKWAARVIRELPEEHPIRSCFESHPERRTAAGVVDAFLHAYENPLSALEWKKASEDAGLELIGETQTESSRSRFLEELLPETQSLDAWTKLQILDDCLELCANPVLWFKKSGGTISAASAEHPTPGKAPAVEDAANLIKLQRRFYSPSRCQAEIGRSLWQANRLLAPTGRTIYDLYSILKNQVGSRCNEEDEVLPGLAVVDYDLADLLDLPAAWSSRDWTELEKALEGKWRLLDSETGKPVPGNSLAQQANWMQTRYGPERPWIEFHFFSEDPGPSPLRL